MWAAAGWTPSALHLLTGSVRTSRGSALGAAEFVLQQDVLKSFSGLIQVGLLRQNQMRSESGGNRSYLWFWTAELHRRQNRSQLFRVSAERLLKPRLAAQRIAVKLRSDGDLNKNSLIRTEGISLRSHRKIHPEAITHNFPWSKPSAPFSRSEPAAAISRNQSERNQLTFPLTKYEKWPK